MDKFYDHQTIEKKWQQAWEKQAVFKAEEKDTKKKYYTLGMFPYPSSAGLHVGHPESYTAIDIVARFKRLQGYNVLNPIGWDAFGLPAENYAIKVGTPPWQTTASSIQNFTCQLKSFGFSYDWFREINTSDPSYYKWTQWLFLKFYENGLAYKKKAKVNWCEHCHTVLANEQVVDNKCERCSHEVVQKDLEQWFFKITKYAEQLLQGLEKLDWPEHIKLAQQNWIGKSEGAEIEFKIQDSELKIQVFTTRPDTLYGATYMVLAPEHELVKGLESRILNLKEVEKYIDTTKRKTDIERTNLSKEKTGVKLEGVMAINPANNKEIPIFIADYVLSTYGTGAIMAVPAHDERDWEFAEKYSLEIKRVVEPKFVAVDGDSAVKPNEKFVYRDAVCAIVHDSRNDSYLCVSWKNFHMHGFVTGGVDKGEDIVVAAKREILEETGYKNVRLVKNPNFALHSLFYHRIKKENRWARFNYLFFELENDDKVKISDSEIINHEILWKKKEELTNFFSVIEGEFTMNFLNNPDYIHTGYGVLHNSDEFNGLDSEIAKQKITKKVKGKMKIQYRLRDWLVSRQRYWGAPIPIIYCNDCGAVPVPEKDLPVLLPQDVDFKPTGESPLASSKKFHKVSCPECGKVARRESDTMDTFVCSSWYFLRYCDPQNTKLPFAKEKVKQWLPVDIYIGGAEHAVMHLLYARFFTKALKDFKLLEIDEPFMQLRNQGMILGEDNQKMSKSRGNVINPDEVVAEYGADTMRIYEMFMGPLDDAKPWSTTSIIGSRRFLEKLWLVVAEWIDNGKPNKESPELTGQFHKTIKKVTEDIISLKFNTAISSMMILVNQLAKEKSFSKENLEKLLIILSPFAPHIAEELWQKIDNKKLVCQQVWPDFDANFTRDEIVTIAIQINGKLRASIKVSSDIEKSKVILLAREQINIQKYLQGKEIVKEIYIPGKIVNLVVKN